MPPDDSRRRHREPAEAMLVRRAETGDEPAIARLWTLCDMAVPYNTPAWDTALCRGATHSRLFVGEIEARVVASAMAGHDDHRGWIYYVAVNPAWQGAGLGRVIVAHAERWLKDSGVWKVSLMIRPSNRQAMGFYEHLGYRETPRVVMAKTLAGDDDGD